MVYSGVIAEQPIAFGYHRLLAPKAQGRGGSGLLGPIPQGQAPGQVRTGGR